MHPLEHAIFVRTHPDKQEQDTKHMYGKEFPFSMTLPLTLTCQKYLLIASVALTLYVTTSSRCKQTNMHV